MWDLNSVCGVPKCKCQHFCWQRGRNCRRRTNSNTTLHRLRGYNYNQLPTATLESSSNKTGDIYDEDPSWRRRNSLKYFWLCQICITLRSEIRYTERKSLRGKISFVTHDFLMNFSWWTLRRLLQRWGQSSRKFWAVCGSLSGPMSSGASAKWTLHYLWTRLTARVSAFTRKSKTLSRFLSLLHPSALSSILLLSPPSFSSLLLPSPLSSITSSLSSVAHVSFSWSARCHASSPRVH